MDHDIETVAILHDQVDFIVSTFFGFGTVANVRDQLQSVNVFHPYTIFQSELGKSRLRRFASLPDKIRTFVENYGYSTKKQKASRPHKNQGNYYGHNGIFVERQTTGREFGTKDANQYQHPEQNENKTGKFPS